ncbi:MAG: methyltransferase domain-containing protein [Gammaproteobacteria bacterium]|nr:methyltransferase domain-containing protein [Gammaproteobacteria bacterium]
MPAFNQHAMQPTTDLDEQARQDFVSSLRAHLSARLMPGAYKVYENRVEPNFRASEGRAPNDHDEVRELMTQDPFYQFWSAMQRRSQEMLWDSVIDPTERQLDALIETSRKLAEGATTTGRGSMRLDPNLNIPRYHTAVDIHLQPGGYHTEFTNDDIAAGVIYDKGINLYMGGALGPENNLMGDILLAYLREKYPDFRPKKILDLGCAIGNSSVVWARAFPQARVHGIDVAAPVLRYAHARAEALGVAIDFSQQNAEKTDFPDSSFDLVLSHIVLHETSRSALPKILRECHRLLSPNGLMLHLEIPRGKTIIEKFMHNWESYNNNETFSRFMTNIDLTAEALKGGFVADCVTVDEFAPKLDIAQMNYAENFLWKILAARPEAG